MVVGDDGDQERGLVRVGGRPSFSFLKVGVGLG